MPITGVFFIPSNPNSSTLLNIVSERLHSALPDDPITPVGRWALEHKLMRDTPSCLPPSASQRPAQPRYIQFLSLSYYPVHGFVYASATDTPGLVQGQRQGHQTQQQQQQQQQHPEPQPQPQSQPQPQQQQADPNAPSTTQPTPPMLMTTVPLPSSATLFQHFVYACQPFWCHRHTHTVLGGVVYDVGDFRVRLGDVRQTQPVARVRGTIVEVEWRGPSLVDSIPSTVTAAAESLSKGDVNMEDKERDEGFNEDGDSGVDMVFDSIEEADVDAEYIATAALIREFWAKLGVEGAREAILVPDIGKEVKERLRGWRQQVDKEQRNTREGDERENGRALDEDPDPEAGVDVARQFMEIFRFNR